MLHITRGGGLNAFSTLKPLQGQRFLPLVFLEDSELSALYQMIASHYPIFLDDSNNNLNFKRNRIRNEILPLLKVEKLNFYKFYWNFHTWDQGEFPSSITDASPSEKMAVQKSHHFIPFGTWSHISQNEKKGILDFYLSLLGFPPLYRSNFEEFLRQAGKERAVIENKYYIIFKPLNGDILLISLKSPLFIFPEVAEENNILHLRWNALDRYFPNPLGVYRIDTMKKGEKIQLSFGKKAMTEIMRERKIPYFLRNKIPILYRKNIPVQILFSMFDSALLDYPGYTTK